MTLLLILFAITLLWLALYLSPAHKVFFRDTLDASTQFPDPPTWPSVAIIVPARNEGAMLPTTLPTLCAQDYPDVRVIVVDDQSDDDTAAVLAQFKTQHPNLITLRAPDRPPGWCGKPWAVAHGVAHAATTADLLLFTDADIQFHPHALRQAVRLLQANRYDLVSLFPQLRFSSTLEKIGLTGLVTVLALMYPAGVINNPKSPQALAAGGFILVRRAPYESVGGHAAVKAHIIEDINLAKILKAAGANLHIRLTHDLLATRMYADFADLWEGLAKNAYAGMAYQPAKFIAGAIFGLLVAVLPPFYLLAALAAALATYPATPKLWAAVALAALTNLLMLLIHRRTTRHFRLAPVHAALMPVTLALYIIIAASSFYQHHFKGGNLWKGRRYTRDMLLADSTPPPADPNLISRNIPDPPDL